MLITRLGIGWQLRACSVSASQPRWSAARRSGTFGCVGHLGIPTGTLQSRIRWRRLRPRRQHWRRRVRWRRWLHAEDDRSAFQRVIRRQAGSRALRCGHKSAPFKGQAWRGAKLATPVHRLGLSVATGSEADCPFDAVADDRAANIGAWCERPSLQVEMQPDEPGQIRQRQTER